MTLLAAGRTFRAHRRPRSQTTQPPPDKESIRDVLRRRQDFVKWALLVLVATLVLVVVGEVVVSRESASPSRGPAEVAKPSTTGATPDIRDSNAPSRHIQTWRGE